MLAALEVLENLMNEKVIIELPDEFDLSYTLKFEPLSYKAHEVVAEYSRYVLSYTITVYSTQSVEEDNKESKNLDLHIPQYIVDYLASMQAYEVVVSEVNVNEFIKFAKSEFLKNKFSELTGVPVKSAGIKISGLSFLENLKIMHKFTPTIDELRFIEKNKRKLTTRIRKVYITEVRSGVKHEVEVFLADAEKQSRTLKHDWLYLDVFSYAYVLLTFHDVL